ncbi:hypothetical protein LPJ71_011764, partial [Coemansia sp. S17]
MSDGESSAQSKSKSALQNLLRNVILNPFSNDNRSAASSSKGIARAGTTNTATAHSSMNLLTAEQQPSPPVGAYLHAAASEDSSVIPSDEVSADQEPADALTLFQKHATIADLDAKLDARLLALEALVDELKGRRVVNIAEFWRALSGTVGNAFDNTDEDEESVAMDGGRGVVMRVLILRVIE